MSIDSHLSLMKRIRSLANNPRLDKHENPNRAKVKKNTPADATSINVHHPNAEVRTQSILKSTDIIRHIVIE